MPPSLLKQPIMISADAMVCTNCDFYVPQEHHFLTETLLEEQVKQCSQQIIKEYGLRLSDFPSTKP